jgi:hypothetical protein
MMPTRMPSSEMLRRVTLVSTDESDERIASIIVTRMLEVIGSSETPDLTRPTRRNIPEDDVLHSHRRENLKSYIALTGWPL